MRRIPSAGARSSAANARATFSSWDRAAKMYLFTVADNDPTQMLYKGAGAEVCRVSLRRRRSSDGRRGTAVASYRPMTVADLGAHLSRAADGRTRWKLVWEFPDERFPQRFSCDC